MNSAVAAYPDAQPRGFHTDPDVSIQNYTYEKLLEYWSMVYTLGLLAGVVGTAEEQRAAKDAVYAALEGAVEEAIGLLDAAATAADDYTPPGAGAAVLGSRRGGLWAAQKVGRFFGQDFGFDDDIENLDRRIRDSVAVDVNQTSQVIKGGKAALESLSKSTGWFDYKAATTQEDRMIAATQSVVNARRTQINAAFSKIWNALKESALARYNQFLSDWKKGGASYAFGTLGVDGAFLALEVAIAAAAGAVTGGAGAIALKVAVSVGKRVGSAARRIVVMLKRAGGNVGKTGRIPLSEEEVVEHAKKHDGFGDDHAGLPRSNHENNKDPGGPDAGALEKKWKPKQVEGRTVYQRADLFDPDFLDPETGLTNRERMLKGKAPIGADGEEINLHHLTQDEPGSMAELTATNHKENSRILHMYRNQHDKYWRDDEGNKHRYQSAPPSMDRGSFNAWKGRYWAKRALDFPAN
ncbi:Hypothetical protein NGAL_HAMBI1145_12950 [Neorhizobium galegae bv. officinalis]|uniref:LHH domain-containing protein n=1 Tax=Neorhizobium galegae bv. officinalis TaxID=323656 RepID=A0A0T7FBW1_NEOGA|nr:HNH/ENDO VII family nuclease [Neorhizobium galegae]CDZ32524.1 Hypothetical protein NGAL_HAMBI1145_12950 [Neorhizobium galegae bv. officinalis]